MTLSKNLHRPPLLLHAGYEMALISSIPCLPIEPSSCQVLSKACGLPRPNRMIEAENRSLYMRTSRGRRQKICQGNEPLRKQMLSHGIYTALFRSIVELQIEAEVAVDLGSTGQDIPHAPPDPMTHIPRRSVRFRISAISTTLVSLRVIDN